MSHIPTKKNRPATPATPASQLNLAGAGRPATRRALRTSSTDSSGMGWITVLVVGILLAVIIGVAYNASSTPEPVAAKPRKAVPTQQQAKTTATPQRRAMASTTPPTPTQQAEPAPTAEQDIPSEQETPEPTDSQSAIAGQDDSAEQEETDAVAAAEEEGTEETPEDSEEEATEENEFVLGGKSSDTAEQAKALNKLVETAIESGDYVTLRDTLAAALKEAYPKIFDEKNSGSKKKEKTDTDEAAVQEPQENTPQGVLAHLDAKKLKVKSKVGQRALAICYCLDLLQEVRVHPDNEKQFMTFLLESGKKGCPAETFLAGISRRRVEKEFAREMMQELCNFYRDEPDKAAREINSITATRADKINKRYYPVPKKELEKEIEKILRTKPSNGADVAQQEAINLSNVYRYICGVIPSLKYDREFGAQAEDAAAACQRAGQISHGLGHSTGLCNLHSGMDARVKSVPGYIHDPGGPNRKARGHRNWILDPAAAKVAFGQAGTYHAMRVMDHSSGWTPPGGYSYPGRGYFPVRYLHGDGWSYYAPPGKTMGEKPKVEMWRLSRAPRNLVSQKDLSKTRQIPIKEVFPNGRYVVFEPDYTAPAMRTTDTGQPDGVYWIRVTGEGFKDEYLVEFY